MPDSSTSFILVDTGVLSRYFLRIPEFVEAYTELTAIATPVISATIYIELMHWLQKRRDSQNNPLTKSEFNQYRNQLDKYPQLGNDECLKVAVQVCRQYADTGLGDCFTIGVGLYFDVDILTANPKHFERNMGVRLFKPINYQAMLLATGKSF